MRHRYIMRDGRLVELDLEAPPPVPRAPMIQSDIAPYRSIYDGERIGGRAQHREHLRRHGLLELGNEYAAVTAPRPDPGPAKGEIANEIRRQLARDPAERRAEAERVLRQGGYEGPAVERILRSDR